MIGVGLVFWVERTGQVRARAARCADCVHTALHHEWFGVAAWDHHTSAIGHFETIEGRLFESSAVTILS